jgi:hypothetical protein
MNNLSWSVNNVEWRRSKVSELTSQGQNQDTAKPKEQGDYWNKGKWKEDLPKRWMNYTITTLPRHVWEIIGRNEDILIPYTHLRPSHGQ